MNNIDISLQSNVITQGIQEKESFAQFDKRKNLGITRSLLTVLFIDIIKKL